MKTLGKLILIIAFSWFILSIYAIFWPTTHATIIKTSNISLTQNGYNSVRKPGISNFEGGNLSFNIISYRYTVNEVSYEGKGSVSAENNNTLKIYYCPIYPAFSLTKNTIPLPWLLLLCILGFGILEFNKWLQDLSKRNQP